MAKAGDIEIKLKVNTGKFKSDMKQAEKSAKKFTSNTKRNMKTMAKSVKNSLGSIKGAVLGLGAAFAVFKGISATKNLIQDMAALSKETLAWSTVLKIGTTDLQGFALAANQVGFSMEKVTDIFKDVNDKIGDFVATGGGEARDVFERLGLSIDDLKGKAPDKALSIIVDQMDRLKGTANELNQQEKIFLLESIANDASKLIPLLANGGAKLKEFKAIAEQSGAILSEDELGALEQFRQQTSVISLQWKGLKNIIGVELLPVITKLAKKIRASFVSGAAQKWVKEVAGKMRKMFDNAIKNIPKMVDGFKGMIPVLKDIASIITTIVDTIMLIPSALRNLSAATTNAIPDSMKKFHPSNEVRASVQKEKAKTNTLPSKALPVELSQKIQDMARFSALMAKSSADKLKLAADKLSIAAKAQSAAAAFTKARSETTIGQILGGIGKGETSRILGSGPEQAQDANFDRIFSEVVAGIQSGDATAKSNNSFLSQLTQIARGQKTFGPAGSSLGMENAIKDLQNFISGKKDDEIKVNIEVEVKPTANFDAWIDTKIERSTKNSLSDAAATTGQ